MIRDFNSTGPIQGVQGVDLGAQGGQFQFHRSNSRARPPAWKAARAGFQFHRSNSREPGPGAHPHGCRISIPQVQFKVLHPFQLSLLIGHFNSTGPIQGQRAGIQHQLSILISIPQVQFKAGGPDWRDWLDRQFQFHRSNSRAMRRC